MTLAWLLFHSWLNGEFWWAKLNVAGALFYGGSVYTMGLGRATAAGAALLLLTYALLGGVFGLFARPRGFTRNLLLGMLTAMAWHYLANRFFWRRLDTFGLAYFPALATLPAHLIFGLSLSRYAARFQHVAETFGDAAWSTEFLASLAPPPPPAPPAEPTAAPEEASQPGPVTEAEPEVHDGQPGVAAPPTEEESKPPSEADC